MLTIKVIHEIRFQGEDVFAQLLQDIHFIKTQNHKIMSNTDTALADLAAIKTSLVKVGTETSTLLQKIIDLENAAGAADTPQSVLDAIADVKAQAQIVDDLVPDAPTV